jgi:membrane protein YdbS with pleckstrin-like domain
MKPSIANHWLTSILGWISLFAVTLAIPVTMICIGVHYDTPQNNWDICIFSGILFVVVVSLVWLTNFCDDS